jgi:hypothetical protein
VVECLSIICEETQGLISIPKNRKDNVSFIQKKKCVVTKNHQYFHNNNMFGSWTQRETYGYDKRTIKSHEDAYEWIYLFGSKTLIDKSIKNTTVFGGNS